MLLTGARDGQAGSCPLGSLVGQLAKSAPEARTHIATGLDQWVATISDGLRRPHADGNLSSDIDPDDLATTFLAALGGLLLLAQALTRSRPYETAVNTLLALTIGSKSNVDQASPINRRVFKALRAATGHQDAPAARPRSTCSEAGTAGFPLKSTAFRNRLGPWPIRAEAAI